MSDEVLTVLLPALDIAAFARRADGTFSALAPHPAWFSRLIADRTFPFLGYILDEAVGFWESDTRGRREWGPCEETDETGHPFHYKVAAVSTANGQYLFFQLDPESDRMRRVLQKVRSDALAAPRQSSAETDTLVAVQREVQRATTEIDELVKRFAAASTRRSQTEIADSLAEKCRRLSQAVDTLLSSVLPPANR